MQQASLAQKSKYTLNVLVVGDRRTGKTSLFSRFADPDAPYPPGLGSTIGCDFKTRSIELEGKTLQLHIWDTSYSGRFQDSPWIYCRNPHVALVVFDASAQETFDDVHNWLRELEERTTGVVPVLVGNKVDISDRRVDTRTAVAVATRYGIPYVETSAEQNVNVDEAFMAGVVKSKFLLDAFHGFWPKLFSTILRRFVTTCHHDRGMESNTPQENALRGSRVDHQHIALQRSAGSDCSRCGGFGTPNALVIPKDIPRDIVPVRQAAP
eukprot:m.109424 g.109424  ORF g.109424 m.109424 type:complete len:267 (+) comp12847_c0_seq2:176-976(+)